MVRLIVDGLGFLKNEDFHFNSTMVRLIVPADYYAPERVQIFQFHDGTIDSCSFPKPTKTRLPFQFHDGTIDSGQMGLCWRLNIYFNSTMVRLIVSFLSFFCCCFIHFNSTMVRLIAINRKTAQEQGANFNSTMVRLIAGVIKSSVAVCSNFNSTMVRLIVYNLDKKIITEVHFNSTMVRLIDMKAVLLCWVTRISIPRWYDW